MAPGTVDTLVVVDRLTGELLLVAAESSATNAAVHLTFTSLAPPIPAVRRSCREGALWVNSEQPTR
jgi:glucose dehydrogenase